MKRGTLWVWTAFFFSVVTHGAVPSGAYLTFTTDYPPVYDIAGFDWLSRFEVFHSFDAQGKRHEVQAGGRHYWVEWYPKRAVIRLTEKSQTLAQVDLGELLQGLWKAQPGERVVPQTLLTVEKRVPAGVLRVFFEDISAQWMNAGPTVFHFKADLLFQSQSSDKATKR